MALTEIVIDTAVSFSKPLGRVLWSKIQKVVLKCCFKKLIRKEHSFIHFQRDYLWCYSLKRRSAIFVVHNKGECQPLYLLLTQFEPWYHFFKFQKSIILLKNEIAGNSSLESFSFNGSEYLLVTSYAGSGGYLEVMLLRWDFDGPAKLTKVFSGGPYFKGSFKRSNEKLLIYASNRIREVNILTGKCSDVFPVIDNENVLNRLRVVFSEKSIHVSYNNEKLAGVDSEGSDRRYVLKEEIQVGDSLVFDYFNGDEVALRIMSSNDSGLEFEFFYDHYLIIPKRKGELSFFIDINYGERHFFVIKAI